MEKFKKYVGPAALLAVLMGLGGVYSLGLGQDVNWDLLNYHLYNPFAFINGRIESDVMAAGIHSTINPLLDLYFYFCFFTFFNSPHWIAFFMGLPYGVLLWVGYYVSKEIFAQSAYPRAYAAAAVVIGGTAAGTMSQIGMTTNEIPCAALSLGALWLILRFLKDTTRVRLLYTGAFVMGATAGLKLTAAPFCLALAAAVFCQWRILQRPWRKLGLFILAGATGFLLTNGYFMWKWYQLYGNPLFPYYNHIFQSPYFDAFYLTETRFFPKTLFQWVFYPFYWAFQPATKVTEALMQDMRLAAGLLAAAAWGGALWKKKITGQPRMMFLSVLVFFVTGYVLWLKQFSILRYAVVLEMLCGVLLVGVCAVFLKGRWSIWAACLLWGMLAVGYQVPDWKHIPFEKQAVVFTDKPKVEDDALVFFMHLPSAYLAPLLKPQATYMGGFVYQPEEYPEEYRSWAAQRNNIQPQYLRFHFEELQRQKIARHEGPVYLVSINWPMLVNPATLARFGLKGDLKDCRTFSTNLTVYSPELAICRVYKAENPVPESK